MVSDRVHVLERTRPLMGTIDRIGQEVRYIGSEKTFQGLRGVTIKSYTEHGGWEKGKCVVMPIGGPFAMDFEISELEVIEENRHRPGRCGSLSEPQHDMGRIECDLEVGHEGHHFTVFGNDEAVHWSR